MKQKLIYFFQIFTPLLLGGLVGFIMSGSMDFQNLNKPFLAPPAIIFPIAWTILYFMIGFSYFLYRKENEFDQSCLLYYAQLFVNLLWPIFFFVLKWRFFSILWILLLIILVAFLMKSWFSKKRICVYLFIPYLLWLFFATYLNIGIYLLN